jgi:replicative DNA helicase
MVSPVSALVAVEPLQIANIEEEAALLGVLLQNRSLIDPVADRVSEEDFAEPLHARIFAAILKLHNEGKPANVVTVKPFFDDDPGMKEVGGPIVPRQIMGSTGVEAVGAKDFASDIRALAEKRKLLGSLSETLIEGRRPEVTPKELISSVETAIAGVSERDDAAVQLTAADAVKRVLDGFGNREIGISSGIEPIDAS